jgi:hypothetical protein
MVDFHLYNPGSMSAMARLLSPTPGRATYQILASGRSSPSMVGISSETVG